MEDPSASSSQEDPADLIEEAAKRLGGQTVLAEGMRVSDQAISKWKRTRIPAERVLDFEHLTGISRHRSRPDIYPRETQPV